jgi:glutathione S-transferase
MRPADALGRYAVDRWLKHADELLHPAAPTVTFAIGPRNLLLQQPPEVREANIAAIPDPVQRATRRSVLEHGVKAPEFAGALRVFLDTLDGMEAELVDRAWISGERFGLADATLLPYVLRLEHLAMDPLLDPAARPHVADWLARVKALPSYAAKQRQGGLARRRAAHATRRLTASSIGFLARVPAVPSLIEVQLDVLLARDAHGRLTTTRDPERRPAPRLFLGRSRDGNVWSVRADVDRATKAELDLLCSAEPTLAAPSAVREPACRERAHALLAPVEGEWRGPAYVLPDGLLHDGRAREVTAESSGEWLEPAAVCHSPRGHTAHAAEAGVVTLEPFRGRGLATAAVACWARAVQRSGRLALYSTSWDNAASQGVARRLRAQLYAEDWHLT